MSAVTLKNSTVSELHSLGESEVSALRDRLNLERLAGKLEFLGMMTDYREATLALLRGESVPSNSTEQIVQQLRSLVGQVLNAGSRESGARAMRMLISQARDTELLTALLAIRLEELETWRDQQSEASQQAAQRALFIYAPLAARLGIFWIKAELEDLSFRMLNPEVYQSLKKLVGKKRGQRAKQVEQVAEEIRALLEQHQMRPEVHGRYKRFFSIHEKLSKVGNDFDRIQDLIAFRVLLPRVRDCYAALGYIHNRWAPKEKRFKDYIAKPKANGYRSLHTTLELEPGDLIEVQIRTHSMHAVAEYGVAAHWRYKDQRRGVNEAHGDDLDAGVEEKLEEFQLDWFEDRVFALTPTRDVIELPRGATALDFAYALHSKIGDGTIGVKIDGAIAKLDTPLHSGCSVEVLTSARQTPGKEWLDFVMTRRAKEKIRYALRQQQRQQFRTQGVEQIEKLFRQAGLNWNRLLKEGRLEQACQEQRNQSLEHLLIQVGEGSFRASDLVAWFTEAGEETRGEPSKALRVLPGEKCRVVVGGLMQVRTRFAKCCTPKPGDAIIGYLAQGHEVRIHHADCDSVTQLDSRRLVEVGWAPAKEGVTEVLAG